MKKSVKKLIRKIANTKLSVVFYGIYQIAVFFAHFFMKISWFFSGEKKPNKEEIELICENVTFIYKSFERQKLSKRLYRNIQVYYPGVKVIIADDSKKALDIQGENVEIIHLPFNSGLSYGLNRALEKVETPFVIRMDDDELLTPLTKWHEQLRFLMDHEEIDLVGVLPYNLPWPNPLETMAKEYYSQTMEKAPKKLKIPHMTNIDATHRVLGKVPNIFIVRTNKMREVGYDDNIRMIDHNEFFYRAAGNIVSVLDETAYVIHTHNPFDRYYQGYRGDVQGDLQYIKEKTGKRKMCERFLEALGASLKGETVPWEKVPSAGIKNLLRLAEQQKVLPLVYEAVRGCPGADQVQEVLKIYSKDVFEQTSMQVVKTHEFLGLYQELCKAGVKPLVVKGLICRENYLLSNHRVSLDEDLLIKKEDFPLVHQVMCEQGMVAQEELDKILEVYEVPYRKEGSCIYIEVHKQLFPEDAEAYGEYNRFFERSHERAIKEEIQGVTVYTMCYTDHLLYLICHAFKHFLHSGIGVRQVCDIVLFANAHGTEIDWNYIFRCCQEMKAEKIVAAIFRMGEKYFGFDAMKACYPKEFREIDVDENNLLRDMLEGGVLGNLGYSRLHSSDITLNAVIADKKGKQPKNSVIKSVFPPARKLAGRYRFLEKHPWLLPVAWATRIVKYGKEGSNPSESIDIGKRRVEMLKEYDVIDKE